MRIHRIALVFLALLPTAARAQTPSYVSYTDPYEHAFTVEVPQGWTIKGGLFRIGYSDVRPMVDIVSPDARTEIRLGDVAIPTYAAPTPYHPAGGTVDLGAQAQMTSANYHTGQQFATIYAQTHFIRACQRLDPQPSEGEPPLKDPAPQSANLRQSTTGQVTYKCSSAAGERTAYAYARTNDMSTLWQVGTLVSFLAPPDRVAAARAILLHASETFHLDPQWVEKQKQEDAYGLQYQRMRQQQRLQALGRQVQQFEQQMQAMRNQVSAFERGQAQRQAQFEKFDQALRGVTPTIDPLGNEREVWTGPYANYYRNGLGVVVNSPTNPGAGWTQLKPEN
ncbi:MAG TPA: hypothetical protein VMH00_00255 [Candidatus Limnocylindrales bacterium]|nr:hypothetical protein [Candidatus Limnocylindrales bacterium]